MFRIDQKIPLAANGRGRDQQRNRLAASDPMITLRPQGIVSGLMPSAGKGMQIKTLDMDTRRNLRLD